MGLLRYTTDHVLFGLGLPIYSRVHEYMHIYLIRMQTLVFANTHK
jgi:hypothetical protein